MGSDSSSMSVTFQSTLPHRERRASTSYMTYLDNFNPRSRTGSDLPKGNRAYRDNISIHAPAQGATESILSVNFVSEDFNPRSRTGSDAPSLPENVRRIISIHAPAQGATRCYFLPCRFLQFQSTLPHRERLDFWHQSDEYDLFQSTLPAQGATSLKCKHNLIVFDFNPRSPRRERLVYAAVDNEWTIHFNPRSPHRERRCRDI